MFDFKYYALSALAVLISLTVHEFSHAFVADKLGDHTARNLGRLSLNPIKHLDIIGALCMLVFKFGWAKPVPINLRNFKNPKRDFAITAIAGPISNITLSIISGFFYLLCLSNLVSIGLTEGFVPNLLYNLCQFLLIMHMLNIGLAIFNLIPIPPLDGSRLLGLVLPPKAYYAMLKNERYIYYGLLGWLLLGDYVARILRTIPFVAETAWLKSLVGIFSLSEILGNAISTVSGWILDLWAILPFL